MHNEQVIGQDKLLGLLKNLSLLENDELLLCFIRETLSESSSYARASLHEVKKILGRYSLCD